MPLRHAPRLDSDQNLTSFVPFGYLPEPDKAKPKPNSCRAGRGKHTDLYQSVTKTVIAQLEAGTVPWVGDAERKLLQPKT